MGNIKTCGELVGIVRSETQELLASTDDGRLRVIDGYASELASYPKTATSIVALLNYVLNNMARETQFNKCYFDLVLTAAKQEYLADRDAAEIVQMVITDSASPGRTFPVYKTSIEELDRQFGGGMWRNMKSNRPQAYYTIGTRAFGFWPAPLGSTLTATYLACATPSDMAEAGDVPAVIKDGSGLVVLNTDGLPESALPAEYHDLIAIGAAARLARMQGDNKTQAQILMQEFEKGKKDLRTLVNDRSETDVKPLGLRTGRRWTRKGGSAAVSAGRPFGWGGF